MEQGPRPSHKQRPRPDDLALLPRGLLCENGPQIADLLLNHFAEL